MIALFPKNFESTTTPVFGLSNGDFSLLNLMASGLITTSTVSLSSKLFTAIEPKGVTH